MRNVLTKLLLLSILLAPSIAFAQSGHCKNGSAVIGLNGQGPPTCGPFSGDHISNYTGPVSITGNQTNGADQISHVNGVRDEINVSTFGVLPTGADFSAGVQTAQAAAIAASPPKNLYFPRGKYNLATLKQVLLGSSYSGAQWYGDGGGAGTAGGQCATELDVSYADSTSLTGCSEAGHLVTCTGSGFPFAIGEAVYITGTSVGGYNYVVCKLTAASSSNFSCNYVGTGLGAATGGNATDAILWVADGASRFHPHDMCIVGSSASTGMYGYAGVPTHSGSDTVVSPGWYLRNLTFDTVPGVGLETSDMDTMFAEHVRATGVGAAGTAAFTSTVSQGAPWTFIAPDLHVNPQSDVFAFTGNASMPNITGGYMAISNGSSSSNNALFHFLSTFAGQSEPLTITSTNWEVYATGAHFIWDDTMSAAKQIILTQPSAGGTQINGSSITVDSQTSLIANGTLANLGPGSITERTNPSTGGANNEAAPSVIFIGGYSPGTPSFQTCTHASPPASCTNYYPHDTTSPLFCQFAISDIHPGTPANSWNFYNRCIGSVGGSFVDGGKILQGGLSTQSLHAPANLTCTPSGSGTTYGYIIEACNNVGLCSPKSSEVTCSGAASLTGVPNVLTWGDVPGANYFWLFGRTMGGETNLVQLTSTTFSDDGSLSPGATNPNAADQGTNRLVINGATSGAAAIAVPTAAGTPTITLPTTNGTAGQVMQSDAGAATGYTWGPTMPSTAGTAGQVPQSAGSNTSAWTWGNLEGEIDTAGLMGNLASSASATLLQHCAKMAAAGHLVSLKCTSDIISTCTTAPTFGTRDTTSTTNGTGTVACSNTAGTVTQGTPGLSFAAGDEVCITRTINGGSCTASQFGVDAHWTEP